jgi:uncharacterized membrane protein YkvA (DUF1232 family)
MKMWDLNYPCVAEIAESQMGLIDVDEHSAPEIRLPESRQTQPCTGDNREDNNEGDPAGPLIAGPNSRGAAMDWRERARSIRREVSILYLVLRDAKTPWYAKVVAACAVGYVFSPIQFIPSFIPVIGFADDILILSLGLRLVHRLTPKEVWARCRSRADVAEAGRCEGTATVASSIIALLVLAIWLLSAAAAGALILRAARAVTAGWTSDCRHLMDGLKESVSDRPACQRA